MHTMATFFSGEDMQELHDNVDKYSYYLSFIVNFAGDYKAKIAYLVKREAMQLPVDDGDGNTTYLDFDENVIMVTVDLDVTIEGTERDELLSTRVAELKKMNEDKRKVITSVNTTTVKGFSTSWSERTAKDPITDRIEKEVWDYLPKWIMQDLDTKSTVQASLSLKATFPNDINFEKYDEQLVEMELSIGNYAAVCFTDLYDEDKKSYDLTMWLKILDVLKDKLEIFKRQKHLTSFVTDIIRIINNEIVDVHEEINIAEQPVLELDFNNIEQ